MCTLLIIILSVQEGAAAIAGTMSPWSNGTSYHMGSLRDNSDDERVISMDVLRLVSMEVDLEDDIVTVTSPTGYFG